MGARGQTGVLGAPMRSGERSGENGGGVSTGGRPTTRTDRTPDSTPNRAGNTQNTRHTENSGQNTPDTEWDTDDTWGATVDADGWIRMPGSGNVSGNVPKDVQENAHSESNQIVPQTFTPRPAASAPVKEKTDKQIRVLEYFDKNAEYDEARGVWILPSVRTMAKETDTVPSYIQSLKAVWLESKALDVEYPVGVGIKIPCCEVFEINLTKLRDTFTNGIPRWEFYTNFLPPSCLIHYRHNGDRNPGIFEELVYAG